MTTMDRRTPIVWRAQYVDRPFRPSHPGILTTPALEENLYPVDAHSRARLQTLTRFSLKVTLIEG